MDGLTDVLIEFIGGENNPLGLSLIAISALIEYLLPPFPGDTITLFAAVLITTYNWSFWAVFASVMVGSVTGSMVAFYLGNFLRKRRARVQAQAQAQADSPDQPAPPDDQRAILDRLVARFRRHGPAYLVINRFLPGIRALFFVAAGMAEMRARAVLFYSAVSAAAWNLALIGIGSAVGANFDTMLVWARRYALVAWIAVGVVALVWMVRFIRPWRRSR